MAGLCASNSSRQNGHSSSRSTLFCALPSGSIVTGRGAVCVSESRRLCAHRQLELTLEKRLLRVWRGGTGWSPSEAPETVGEKVHARKQPRMHAPEICCKAAGEAVRESVRVNPRYGILRREGVSSATHDRSVDVSATAQRSLSAVLTAPLPPSASQPASRCGTAPAWRRFPPRAVPRRRRWGLYAASSGAGVRRRARGVVQTCRLKERSLELSAVRHVVKLNDGDALRAHGGEEGLHRDAVG